jgi:23S rRNA (guanosine2251-2'-O)-methyltransferase
MLKLKPKELRTMSADPEIFQKLPKNPVYIIVDNVLDTYNVGAIFRLADAVAASEVLLCGATETPPHTRIKKASINTTEWVKWSYFADTKEAIRDLRSRVEGIQIVAVEQDEKSMPYDTFDYHFPVALIVGHETDGISQEVMDLCDAVVEMPMWGVNVSMNVMVSLGIALFEVMRHVEK